MQATSMRVYEGWTSVERVAMVEKGGRAQDSSGASLSDRRSDEQLLLLNLLQGGAWHVCTDPASCCARAAARCCMHHDGRCALCCWPSTFPGPVQRHHRTYHTEAVAQRGVLGIRLGGAGQQVDCSTVQRSTARAGRCHGWGVGMARTSSVRWQPCPQGSSIGHTADATHPGSRTAVQGAAAPPPPACSAAAAPPPPPSPAPPRRTCVLRLGPLVPPRPRALLVAVVLFCGVGSGVDGLNSWLHSILGMDALWPRALVACIKIR